MVVYLKMSERTIHRERLYVGPEGNSQDVEVIRAEEAGARHATLRPLQDQQKEAGVQVPKKKM